ncbi:UNKNOWN [Stylonychia lemnae]|uniref:Uncharacterized protein n=1 Tax=Stylonychia lemnae TaxID=5949 RepID=A0A078ATC6_STYLE|nr:UNKNOWN [Stylonychia lemnae]|eukprot:CDW85700.1 UNKNOWN [Stylonychia lemnae]
MLLGPLIHQSKDQLLAVCTQEESAQSNSSLIKLFQYIIFGNLISIEQGAALTIIERNKKPNEEVNIKPITQTKIGAEHYKPSWYLNPYDTTSNVSKDVSLNNLHSTRIFNRKQAAEELKSNTKLNTGREIGKNDFNLLKTQDLNTKSKFASTQKLVPLVENHNYISQPENDFYKNTKIFFKPQQNAQKYHFCTPDYLRVNRDARMTALPESMTVLSRSNGWLTVDPSTQSRKNAFDKQVKGNMHKSSNLSPQWMQTEATPDVKQAKIFKAQSLNRQNVRGENSRVLLAEPSQNTRSIFNIGQMRHNLTSKEDVMKYGGGFIQSAQPARLLEWKEDFSKQKYETACSPKVGQQI